MASIGGHKGGIALADLLDIIERHAYRQRCVRSTGRGAKRGLPPDIVTIQAGLQKDGFWFNLKRGMVPEYAIRGKARVEDDEEVLEDLNRLGWIPNFKPGAKSMFAPGKLKKYHKPELLYVGWREVMGNMLKFRLLRESDELEELLGAREYRHILLSRRRWEQAMAVEITAD